MDDTLNIPVLPAVYELTTKTGKKKYFNKYAEPVVIEVENGVSYRIDSFPNFDNAGTSSLVHTEVRIEPITSKDISDFRLGFLLHLGNV